MNIYQVVVRNLSPKRRGGQSGHKVLAESESAASQIARRYGIGYPMGGPTMVMAAFPMPSALFQKYMHGKTKSKVWAERGGKLVGYTVPLSKNPKAAILMLSLDRNTRTFHVGNLCRESLCDCFAHDMKRSGVAVPPLHDRCDCYLTEE